MLNVKNDFALNQQFVIEGQSILSEVHRAFNGIFNGDNTEVHFATLHSIQDIRDGAIGQQFGLIEISLRTHSLFSEGPKRSKKRHPQRSLSWVLGWSGSVHNRQG